MQQRELMYNSLAVDRNYVLNSQFCKYTLSKRKPILVDNS